MRQALAVVGAAVMILSCSGEAAEVFSDAMTGIGGAMVDAGARLQNGGAAARDAGRPVASGSGPSGPGHETFTVDCDRTHENETDSSLTTQWFARVDPFDDTDVIGAHVVLCGREAWGSHADPVLWDGECTTGSSVAFGDGRLHVNCGQRIVGRDWDGNVISESGVRRRTAKITIIRQ